MQELPRPHQALQQSRPPPPPSDALPRLLRFAPIVLALELAAFTWLVSCGGPMRYASGEVFGGDFSLFYAAGTLACAGVPEGAYEHSVLASRQEALGLLANTGWQYPPPGFLYCLPVSLPPYKYAFAAAAALSTTLLCLLGGILRLPRPAILLLVASPAAFLNLANGQNAALTTFLAWTGLALLEQRPALAGCLWGALCYKPHFLPVLLLAAAASGRWKTLAAAAATAFALSAVAFAAWGPEPWAAFVRNASVTADYLTARRGDIQRMISFPSALLALSIPVAWTLAAHATLFLGLGIFVWRLWRRSSPDRDLRLAATAVAVTLALPYGFYYELLVTVPAVLLALRGNPPRALALLGGLVLLLPLVLQPVAAATHLQITPWTLAAFFLCLARHPAGNRLPSP